MNSNRIKILFFIVFLGCIGEDVEAQKVGTFIGDMRDSIRLYKKEQKPKLLLGFDNRVTFLRSSRAQVNGLKIGLNYKKFHYFLGFYGTNRDILTTSFINQQNLIPDTQVNRLRFGYLSLGFTYSHWATEHWYLESTAQLGLGTGESITYVNSNLRRRRAVGIFPAEIGTKAFYMVTPWIGAGAGLGMRKALGSSTQFDGLFYSLSVRFLLGQFYRDVIRKKK